MLTVLTQATRRGVRDLILENQNTRKAGGIPFEKSNTWERKDLAKGESRVLQAEGGRRLVISSWQEEGRESRTEVDAFVEMGSGQITEVGTGRESVDSWPSCHLMSATRSYDSFSSWRQKWKRKTYSLATNRSSFCFDQTIEKEVVKRSFSGKTINKQLQKDCCLVRPSWSRILVT